jgi:hypothetical protein
MIIAAHQAILLTEQSTRIVRSRTGSALNVGQSRIRGR